MARPDDLTRLRHILDAAEKAGGFVGGRARHDLDTDEMLSLALVRLLEIIGEAAAGISPGLRRKYPDLPWQQMTGMRNRLIHGYFDVNPELIWRTVTEELPPLREGVRKALENETETTGGRRP
ncbi:MAG: DUF86 domain-containing protein [Candidatus Aminicenantes bacterium]|nr:DUF86 domain-containing protein [Candidatus Aminicenantes bacterium]